MLRVGDEPVPGYRLEEVLGSGSTAQVWRASAPGRTTAALKFINLGGRLGLKEFRGIERVKEIRHPHLLPITAFWMLDDRDCVLDDEALETLVDAAHGRQRAMSGTMELETAKPATLVVAMLLGDKNLLERLREHRQAGRQGIPVDELLGYLEDAAKGIDFLNSPRHDLGSGPVAIQHCDIKPQNIVLVGNSAMVCDFGLARVLGGEDISRTVGGTAGTPAYMAPESFEGTVPSHATDQYSLAITYVELRTGKLPVSGELPLELYEAHVAGKLDLARLPGGEREVIRRATSIRPEDRFSNSLDMVRALRRAAEGDSASSCEVGEVPPRTGACPPPLPARVSRPTAGAPPPRAAMSESETDRDADTYKPTLREPGSELDLPPDAAAPAPQTYVIRFQPAAAEVTINGTHEELDGEGRVQIRGWPETSLDILATKPGYQQFKKTVTIAQLETLSFEITLRYDAQYFLDRGTAKLRRGETEAAVVDFGEAIRLDEDLAAAYDERAHAYFTMGHYIQAAADFTEVIRISPELAKAHRCRVRRNRGLAYRKQGEYDKALADYDEVIRLHPTFARAYHDRAMVHAARRDYDRAIEDYTQAVQLMQDDADADCVQNFASAYRGRADERYRKGKYAEALADYDQAIRLRPDWGIAYNQRGLVHGAVGEYDKAIVDYTKSIELDTDFEYVYYYNRGCAYDSTGDYARAIADFTAAIKRKPDYASAYRFRGRVHEKMGEKVQAEADLTKARALEYDGDPVPPAERANAGGDSFGDSEGSKS